MPEKTSVYGIANGNDEVWVIPVDDVAADDVLTGTVDGRDVVALRDATDDIAVYEAPSASVKRTDTGLVESDGTVWTIGRTELRSEGGDTRERIPGRHGLWFAFRTHYQTAHVLV